MNERILAGAIVAAALIVCFTFRNEYLMSNGTAVVKINRLTGKGTACAIVEGSWTCRSVQ
ncbi:MAG: hypothetical protein E5V86_04005 [Mesorhizobium sp.]|nr:MAG: hypothetical protein E5V86_04005 [Mesorhizobium sp.]